jgi:hypothetical protein
MGGGFKDFKNRCNWEFAFSHIVVEYRIKYLEIAAEEGRAVLYSSSSPKGKEVCGHSRQIAPHDVKV